VDVDEALFRLLAKNRDSAHWLDFERYRLIKVVTAEVTSFKLVAEDKVAIEVDRSVRSQVRAEHSGTLQPLSLEARHEGLSVLSNRRCASAVFCGRTYTWFSPVRSHMGS
jgi:hypothetical protein